MNFWKWIMIVQNFSESEQRGWLEGKRGVGGLEVSRQVAVSPHLVTQLHALALPLLLFGQWHQLSVQCCPKIFSRVFSVTLYQCAICFVCFVHCLVFREFCTVVHFDNTISECGGRWGHADNLITLCTHCVAFLGNLCSLKYEMCIACYELYAVHNMN